MSTAMIWQTVSTSSDDTVRLGQLLGSLIKSPEVIELRSDLGGGKTTFVKGLVKGLGSHDIVTSPTFTLHKIYKTKTGQQVHHYDFYRLNEAGILSDELAESLADPSVTTVVEWPAIVDSILPASRLAVEFRPVEVNVDERLIVIEYPASKIGLMKKLVSAWQEIRP